MFWKTAIRQCIKLLILFTCLIHSQDVRKISDPIKYFETFCREEFNGYRNIQRRDLIIFSNEREKKELKIDPEFGGMVVEPGDKNIILVDTFSIIKLTSQENDLQIGVQYHEVARSTNILDSIVPVNINRDTIIYNLKYYDNRWWVLDPPTPRMSIVLEIEHTFSNIQFFEKHGFKNTTGARYQSLMNKYTMLKKIYNEYKKFKSR